ncbi:MAG TPA: HlyD family efflux transporter periplasmic adaptor subunit, partial [Vicinamibacterales bacterium]|nr:HlyD family efflux transporter periplasmic adaptor subunit [Vicinamibacterales bacterium]
PGQTVAASAPLLQIAQVSTLWVRVPVFAGDTDQIDPAQPVAVSRLGSTDAPKLARRVTAPLKADPSAASVDLYYELPATGFALRPGERVMVEVPLRGSERGLVVPEASVLYDIHGDAWVYEDLGGNAYARRRVQIARHVGDRAVIARGIAEGAKVVTAGAAELFGTEFGAGH